MAHSKLNRREDQVGCQIDGKGKCDPPANLSTQRLHENKTKTHENDRIENLPNRAMVPGAGVQLGFASELYHSIQDINDFPNEQMYRCERNRLWIVDQ